MIRIEKATANDIPALIPLFDQYRVFYEQTSDKKAASSFLEARIRNKESVIFLAFLDQVPVGFVQLYKTFSSVSLEPVFILNDLFVIAQHRSEGIGKQLLEKAKAHCRLKGYKGLSLETAIDNPAQKLYESLGWKKDSHCFHYFWKAT